jgi:hypothetical protein
LTNLPWKTPPRAIGGAGIASEKRVSRSIGGRQTPASGALAGAKGDINREDVLLEAKSTSANSISIKYVDLAKITREARSMQKFPALTVSFTMPDGTAVPDGDWVLVPLSEWKDRIA